MPKCEPTELGHPATRAAPREPPGRVSGAGGDSTTAGRGDSAATRRTGREAPPAGLSDGGRVTRETRSAPAARLKRASDGRARIGLVGLSGYGGDICDLLRSEDSHPAGRTRFAAVYAPDAEHHTSLIRTLREADVTVHRSYEDLLGDESVDGVWLPVPIHLHRPMGEAALRAGKPLMLEKPVAGSVADHLALLWIQQEMQLPTLIGFQDIYAPGTALVKRRLLDGKLGRPLRAVVHGCWPRPDAYYARNAWAGALRRDGVAVSDSPLSNAMAHFVNLALFWLGGSFHESAPIRRIRSELWRARPIESFDTCSLRATVESAAGPVDLIVLLTHATSELLDPVIEIDTERGTLRWSLDGHAEFHRPGHAGNGSASVPLVPAVPPRPHMMRTLGQLVQRSGPASNGWLDGAPGAVATLENSLSHTVLFESAHRATRVVSVPEELLDIRGAAEQRPRDVRGLAAAIRRAAAQRKTLVESGVELPSEVGVLDDPQRLLTGRPGAQPPQHQGTDGPMG